MTAVLAILHNTPWWAFVVGALLVTFGVRSLRPRNVAVPRLLIVPAIFMTWGLASLVLRSLAEPLLGADWLACCVAGFAIGWQTTRLDGMRVDPGGWRVTLPGRRAPLVRNVSIFAAKYALGVAFTLAPAWHGEIALADIGVSGLSEGYFIAWLLCLGLYYRRALRPVATT